MHSAAASADFERTLEAALARFEGSSPVTEMIRYHFETGADRLRARLVLAACVEEGGDPARALDAACAIEIVHDYARLHLDVAAGRRSRDGRAAVWERFGLAHGINTGDALCTLGYLTLLTRERPAEVTAAMTRVLHAANLAMCAMQSRNPDAMEDDHNVTWGKTAALIGAACRLGAIAANADERRTQAYGELGAALHSGPAAADAVANAHGIDRGGRVREAIER
ncbi:MAG: hypothetical protein NVS3B28_09400 [Candidatus Velthaea sp.]